MVLITTGAPCYTAKPVSCRISITWTEHIDMISSGISRIFIVGIYFEIIDSDHTRCTRCTDFSSHFAELSVLQIPTCVQ